MIVHEKNRIENKLWKHQLKRMRHTPYWRVVMKSLTKCGCSVGSVEMKDLYLLVNIRCVQ